MPKHGGKAGREQLETAKLERIRREVEDLHKSAADELLDAWVVAYNVHDWLREVAASTKNSSRLRAKPRLGEWLSKFMGLAYHLQPKAKRKLTPLDLAISEGNVRDLANLGDNLEKWAGDELLIEDVSSAPKKDKRGRTMEYASWK